MAFYYKQNIILLISLLICIISQTNGKDVSVALIKQMCGVTNAPVQCTSCVSSNNKDIRNGVDVINAMLDCASTSATKLKEDVNNILRDKTTNPKTRHVIQEIEPYVSSALSKNKLIQRKVTLGYFNEATDLINGIVSGDLVVCSNTLFASEIKLPPPVFSGLFSVESDYKFANQLITLKPKN